jgi:ubiquinone/menaquinone biosynthesis C-methylase UbiE
MSADSRTLAVYNTKAAEYDALVNSEGPSAWLAAFIAAVPKGARVLDFGCGTGSAAASMRDHGLRVTALDASVEMVALAKRRFDLDVILGTFDDLASISEYDGVWASFSLLHAPREDMPRYLAAIHRALRPNGRFNIGLKTGTGEQRDSLGRRYTYYTETELRGLLANAGFTITHTNTGAGPGLDGVIAPWITIDCHA